MGILTDGSKMPFGKYTGEKLITVPASYLLWICDNGKCNAEVKAYIEENLDALRKEVEENKGRDAKSYSRYNKAQ